MPEDWPLVGVIVPMYNASQTIDATLTSICAQTYRNLDIVVVDDGSTDDSGKSAQMWAEREPRLRLLRQLNSGVAAARNFGAANTPAEYLAFIDADDLWAPEKIEVQMRTLLNGESEFGLVYSWYALIDRADRVVSLKHQPTAEGWVLPDLLQTNLVGNGSSALVRRKAFERVGGFDQALREGSEDIAIYLRIAERYEFRVIRRHLVGYRMLPNNMSSDFGRMVRSCEAVLSEYRLRYPQFIGQIESHLNERRFWLFVRAASEGYINACYQLLIQMWHANPQFIVFRIPKLIVLVCRARAARLVKLLMELFLPRALVGSRYRDENW